MSITDLLSWTPELEGFKSLSSVQQQQVKTYVIWLDVVSLQPHLEHPLKEVVYNLLSRIQDNGGCRADALMGEINHLFVHSNSRS
jgi:hypothetical protein